ncbi:TPA: hypothetical protein DCZ46_02280 [Candidatus Campbellbacteria bacterium]|uniref:Uncharacterized protein n=1 Tax=Candidatus Nomurabacteria bacterium GW2011_GWC2_42_20 TaxID=1618756 RepID=A0A0G0ZHY7_9BACT|nr:MAG: hypothetical protein UU88_C0003G0015 [Parcubacteria group bacterium GW2011_GWC1_42_11]KKS48350.1 MAG: hypothetical protein UV12_C0001G0045 [Candidatus Nomurabacteria bacterium GW2011_GWC2_42_20]KKS59018.1 MAG: hypothetical protein UV24_C0009G0009 [Candidatus Nomurabacteria bacterium GW2011_GWA2_42_41]KKT09926.1 MAG: hypothetical protein UV86_C0001G0028 [Candidatus Nomurabacteria bacterium GW2011_GWB1_43_20]TAN35576.1 MAG: hypothetical protein EPN27_03410 [Patescibacteria group bacterium
MKKLLAIILCASIITPSFVFASEKSEQKRDNDYRKSAQMVDKNEKRESSKEKSGEEKVELKDKKYEKKAQKQVELVVKRIESAIERVQKLSNRVSERLNKLEAEGFDVTTSRAYLTEATKKLDDARVKESTLKIDTATFFATTTQIYNLKNIQSSVKDIIKVIQGAHKNVAQAISSAKPGQSKSVNVATSTAVTQEAFTATITDAVI